MIFVDFMIISNFIRFFFNFFVNNIKKLLYKNYINNNVIHRYILQIFIKIKLFNTKRLKDRIAKYKGTCYLQKMNKKCPVSTSLRIYMDKDKNEIKMYV